MRVTMKDLYASPDGNMLPGLSYDVEHALGDQLIENRHAVLTAEDPSEETAPATKRRTATREQPSRRGAPSPAETEREPSHGPDDDTTLQDRLAVVGASEDGIAALGAEIEARGDEGAQLAAALAASDEPRLEEFVELWEQIAPHRDDAELVTSVIADFLATQRSTSGDEAPAMAAKAPRSRKR